MSSRRRSREAGFSYIEILVGIVILAIIAGGIAQGLAQTSAALGTSKVETTANKLASAELDRAHRMSYDDVGVVGGEPARDDRRDAQPGRRLGHLQRSTPTWPTSTTPPSASPTPT